MLIHHILNLTRWSASFFADLMNGDTTGRLRRHSRVNALLSGINVILANAGIHNPVATGIMDTRVRGYDDVGIFKFKVSKRKISLQTPLNDRLLQLPDSLTSLKWAGGSND